MSGETRTVEDLLEVFADRVTPVPGTVPVAVRVGAEALFEVGLRLKETHGFNYLANLTAVDYQDRFEVVYYLYSVPENRGIVLKTAIPRENPVIASVVPVWPAANWQEREVYDMFGIVFEGHPSLKRILLPQDFEGHPLRKDFAARR